MSHRFSGWPGAFCFDCGTEDLNEIAVAEGVWVETDPDRNPPCPEPGSDRHNPYTGYAPEHI